MPQLQGPWSVAPWPQQAYTEACEPPTEQGKVGDILPRLWVGNDQGAGKRIPHNVTLYVADIGEISVGHALTFARLSMNNHKRSMALA